MKNLKKIKKKKKKEEKEEKNEEKKEKNEEKNEEKKDKKDENLIEDSIEEPEKKEKEEKKEKKGKKEKKDKKRSKSKKKRKDNNDTEDTNENEKNSLDNKNTIKRKKSRSISKKKKDLISDKDSQSNTNNLSEKDSQSNTNTNNPSEKEDDKISKMSEARKIIEQKRGENYDIDMEKGSNIDDIIMKKVTNLKESKDFDGILNEQKKQVKKNDNSDDEDEKEIEFFDVPDKTYDLIDDNNNKEKKSENSSKKKKKDKKKAKKKKNPANPFKKKTINLQVDDKKDKNNNNNDINNDIFDFSEIKQTAKKGTNNANNEIFKVVHNNQVPNSNEPLEQKEDEENKIFTNDYIRDKGNFKKFQKDKRGLLHLIISMIMNNNTIFFVIFRKPNDLFALISVILLSLSFYIFLNTFLMFNSSSLHLLLDQDNDLNEKTKGNYFILNIFIPCLLYYVTSQIKKWVSIKEFIFDKRHQYDKYDNVLNDSKLIKGEKNIRLHDLVTDISIFIDKKQSHGKNLFIFGCAFLIFNWYYITCFLGIYENSYDCLILNVFSSIMCTLGFTLIFFVLSSLLRYLFGKTNEFLFDCSQFFNPIYKFYNELPYNDKNDFYDDLDDKNDKDEKKDKKNKEE